MAKRIAPFFCSPENCGDNYPRCGKAYSRGCRCVPCSEAASAAARRYYERNREKVLANRKAYYEANRSVELERFQAYGQANRSKKKLYDQERYAANKEQVIERASRWVKSNKERRREISRGWKQRNPEAGRTYAKKRYAQQKSATVMEFNAEQLKLRMQFHGNRCWIRMPGCSGKFDDVDHVKPLAAGGLHALANLRPACRSCNSRKNDKWPFNPEDYR